MTHASSQPTLNAPRDQPFTRVLDGLDLVELAAWCAFEQATDQRAPICPSLRLTFQLLQRLQDKRILRLSMGADDPDYPARGRALYEPVCWAYMLEPPQPGALRALLLEHLRAARRTLPTRTEDTLWLWKQLAGAEFDGYLGHLLRRHGFEPLWVGPLSATLFREFTGLSLAQRRYVAWASVREGASVYLRTGGNTDRAQAAIATEMRRRARWSAAQGRAEAAFTPASNWRQPLLLSLFLSEIAPLGTRYWTEPPTLSAVVHL